MLLIFILIAVPLIEIALFVTIGGEIGLPFTLAVVLVTAIVGGLVLRRQGQETLNRAARPSSIADLETAMTDGAMLLASGLLLLTPGFFTDALGVSLLLPPVRRRLARFIASRATVVMAQQRARADAGGQPDGRSPSARPGDVEDAVELPIDDDRRR